MYVDFRSNMSTLVMKTLKYSKLHSVISKILCICPHPLPSRGHLKVSPTNYILLIARVAWVRLDVVSQG